MARGRGGTKIGIQVSAQDGVTREARKAGESLKKLADTVASADSKVVKESAKMSEALAKQAMSTKNATMKIGEASKPTDALAKEMQDLAKQAKSTSGKLDDVGDANKRLKKFAEGLANGTEKASEESTKFRKALTKQASAGKDVQLTLAAMAAEAGSTDRKVAELSREYENNLAKLRALRRANEKFPADLLESTVALEKQIKTLRKSSRQINETTSRLSKFGKVSKPAFIAAGAALAAFAVKATVATRIINESAQSFRDLANETFLANQRIGVSPELYSSLAFAARGLGEDASVVSKVFSTLALNAEKGTLDFAKWGISIKDASGKVRTTDVIFRDAVDTIGQMGSELERTAAVQEIFGKSGLKLLPVFRKGTAEFAALNQQAREFGVLVTDTSAALGAQLDTAFVAVSESALGMKVSLGQAISPALIPVLEEIGKQFGLISGEISEVDNSAQRLIRGPLGSLLTASSALVTSFEFVRKVASTIETGISLIGLALVKTVSGAIIALQASLTPFEKIFDGLMAIGAIDTNPLAGAFDGMRRSVDEVSEGFILQAKAAAKAAVEQSKGAEIARRAIDGLRGAVQETADITTELRAVQKASNQEASKTAVVLDAAAVKARKLSEEFNVLRDRVKQVGIAKVFQEQFAKVATDASALTGVVQSALLSIPGALASAFATQPAQEELIRLQEEIIELQGSMRGLDGSELVTARVRMRELQEDASTAAEMIESRWMVALKNIAGAIGKLALQFITAAAAKGAAEAFVAHVGIPGIGLGLGLAASGAALAAILALTQKVPSVPNFNRGGMVGGQVGSIDNVPALLTSGESVLPVGLTDALRRVLQVPSGASGGAGSGSAVTAAQPSGGNGGVVTVNVSTFVPQSKFSFRRMVKEELVPELVALNRQGMLRLT